MFGGNYTQRRPIDKEHKNHLGDKTSIQFDEKKTTQLIGWGGPMKIVRREKFVVREAGSPNTRKRKEETNHLSQEKGGGERN